MEGVQIEKSTGGLLASLSALAAVASVSAGIFIGPKGMYVSSGVGAAAAIAGVILAWRNPSLEKPYGFPSIMILVHGSLLFAGFTLHALPMKIAGGSGAPTRIVAVLDEHAVHD